MSSVNKENVNDIAIAFNKMASNAATNDSKMANTVKQNTQSLIDTINNSSLTDAQKSKLSSTAESLLPIAGVAGHASEWNPAVSSLVQDLNSLMSGGDITTTTQKTTPDHYTIPDGDKNRSINSNYGYSSSNGVNSSDNSSNNDIFNNYLNNSFSNSLNNNSSDDISDVSNWSDNTNSTSSSGDVSDVSSWSDNTSSTSSSGDRASTTDTTLYPDGTGPQVDDVNQRGIGDCALQAQLASLAQNDPSAITNIFSAQTSDGGYDLTLYPNGEKTTVHVSPSELASNGVVDEDGKQSWAAYIEAAAMKAMNTDFSNGSDPAAMMQLLTGSSGTDGSITSLGSGDALISEINDRVSSGKLVTASTSAASTTSDGTEIVASHAYSVLSASDGTVTVRNPWGGDNNGIITMSVSDFERVFDGLQYQS